MDSVTIMFLLTFGVLDCCGMFYIAKSIYKWMWHICELNEKIKEAEKELD